jgi:hypothetical protein
MFCFAKAPQDWSRSAKASQDFVLRSREAAKEDEWRS